MTRVARTTQLSEEERTLVELGFSEYEARTYIGLVGQKPKTGYAVAKATGVPMPKVYETLDRLAAHGMAFKVADEPALWVAPPPEQVLTALQRDFDRRLVNAKLNLSKLTAAGNGERVVPFVRYDSWLPLRSRAAKLINSSMERLYISGRADDLQDLKEELIQADERGIRIHLLTFGSIDIALDNGEVVRHASTERVIFPHHQVHHLAVSVDDSGGLWGLAPDGEEWVGISADDTLLPSLVRGYIRHDIFVQQIFSDFGSLLEEHYGAGLQGLYSGDSTVADGASTEAV